MDPPPRASAFAKGWICRDAAQGWIRRGLVVRVDLACDPAAAEELLKREGAVPKTNGGEEVEEVAGVVEAAGAVEEREPGEVTESMAAADGEESVPAMWRTWKQLIPSWKDISLIDLQITVHHYMIENCTSYTSGTRARRGLPILELRQRYISI